MNSWTTALQETTEETLKHSDLSSKKITLTPARSASVPLSEEVVPNALDIILSVAGNHECADCGSMQGKGAGFWLVFDGYK